MWKKYIYPTNKKTKFYIFGIKGPKIFKIQKILFKLQYLFLEEFQKNFLKKFIIYLQ